MTAPVVSVVLLTYDHEPYVAQAIESVLSQDTDFPVELIISEDCSTDGTRAIVLDQAARHPDRVVALLSTRNQNDNEVVTRAYARARGEFVAYLDGDDHWTSPRKLQRQVDLLRARPDLSGCFHAVDVIDGDGRLVRRAGSRLSEVTTQDLLGHNPIRSPSALLRRSALGPLPAWLLRVPYTDWPLYLLAARSGPIGYLDQSMAAYREHAGGLWSGATATRQNLMVLALYDTVLPHVSPGLRRRARRYESAWWAELAKSREAEGRPLAALPALLRSVLLAPCSPRSSARPRTRLERTRWVARVLARRLSAAAFRRT